MLLVMFASFDSRLSTQSVLERLFEQVWDMKTKKIMEDLPGHADEVMISSIIRSILAFQISWHVLCVGRP